MPLDPVRVQAVFLAVVQLREPADRAAVLDAECAGDAELRLRVEALLSDHDKFDGSLDASLNELRRNGGATQAELTADHAAASTVGPPRSAIARSLPRAFGRYEVRNTIGAGVFGTVYLGHDTQLDRPVAIKVLCSGVNAPHTETERFLREARRLARLSHPGIVTVHDVGVQEGQVYIVSDYLKGPDLAAWLKHNAPSWHEAARIAAKVADALAHAHARLTVHRDVKPANIILIADRGPAPGGFWARPR